METPSAARLFHDAYQHRQAGHAALHLLELADVDERSRRSPSRRTAPPSGAPTRPSAACRRRAGSRATRPPPGPGGARGRGEVSSSAGSEQTIVSSGSAVIADFRCSTLCSGTGTTVRPREATWRAQLADALAVGPAAAPDVDGDPHLQDVAAVERSGRLDPGDVRGPAGPIASSVPVTPGLPRVRPRPREHGEVATHDHGCPRRTPSPAGRRPAATSRIAQPASATADT